MTHDVVRAIRAALRKEVRRPRVIELGERATTTPDATDGINANSLLWDEDADLSDTLLLDGYVGETIPGDDDGYVLLDCYLYATERDGGGLTDNWYVALNDAGKIVAAGFFHHEVVLALKRHRRLREVVADAVLSVAGKLDPDTPLGIVADYIEDHGGDATEFRAALKALGGEGGVS